jgi:hypothetical protein
MYIKEYYNHIKSYLEYSEFVNRVHVYMEENDVQEEVACKNLTKIILSSTVITTKISEINTFNEQARLKIKLTMRGVFPIKNKTSKPVLYVLFCDSTGFITVKLENEDHMTQLINYETGTTFNIECNYVKLDKRLLINKVYNLEYVDGIELVPPHTNLRSATVGEYFDTYLKCLAINISDSKRPSEILVADESFKTAIKTWNHSIFENLKVDGFYKVKSLQKLLNTYSKNEQFSASNFTVFEETNKTIIAYDNELVTTLSQVDANKEGSIINCEFRLVEKVLLTHNRLGESVVSDKYIFESEDETKNIIEYVDWDMGMSKDLKINDYVTFENVIINYKYKKYQLTKTKFTVIKY